MTEDMLEEHTEIILKLSKSEDGSKYLTQMQSLLLFSDVQSFKVRSQFISLSQGDTLPAYKTFRLIDILI